MKASQIVVAGLVILGVALGPIKCHGLELQDPKPCLRDNGSEGPGGLGSCVADVSDSLHVVSIETSIEQISSADPILSLEALAKHVVDVSEDGLGFPAILSDDDLASLAWSFRLRHMPAPLVIAKKSTKYDVERLVRYVLTNEQFRARHHLKECKINEIIKAVKDSIEIPNGFVFRIFEGDDAEYSKLHLHQLYAIQHYFAAVHTEKWLFVSVVSSKILGEFIKGHGGENAVLERAHAAQFLRQWLLNQWVNLWICTNPNGGDSESSSCPK
jgi:hypothetical protein